MIKPITGMLAALVVWLSPVAAEGPFAVDEPGFNANARSLLQTYCAQCHSGDSVEGDFDLEKQLGLNFNQSATSSKWSEVANVLNSHEMPPDDEPQPEAEEVARLVDWIRSEQIRAEAFDRKSNVAIRRLNRNEYRNTIRDLFGVDYSVDHFPQDPPAGGFDNNGRALASSPLQVELYLAAAKKILDTALVIGDQPKAIVWRFQPESGDSDSNRVRYGIHNAIVNGGKNRREAETRVMHHNNWDRKINVRDFAVSKPGRYVIRIRAASAIPNRGQVLAYAIDAVSERYEKDLQKQPERRGYIEEKIGEDINHFRESPIYDYGPGRLKVTVHLNGQPQIVGTFDVDATTDAMKVFELPVEMTTEKAGITLEYAYAITRTLENFPFQSKDDFPRPEVVVDWLELAGPLHDAWPPTTHQRLIDRAIPESPASRRQLARDVLARFMPRACRRPVTDSEIDEKMRLFDIAQTESLSEADFIEQIKIPLTGVLVSPHFLYLAEPFRGGENDALTPLEIASRLSYFLWSSMPDEALFQAAAGGELSQPDQLVAQVNRMLADPKSSSLGKNFAAQWLGLRDVGANPPTAELYPDYSEHVEESIVRQSIALFNDILHNDRDVAELIDSDHEMLNQVLARYYSLPRVEGDEMRRVELPSDSSRGGVMTHASVLTITSNGTRTSPVKRGTWVLKTILGTDPGLPVANAGDIAPKVPGIDKATVRQRLEIHRELAQCARCHSKIDPLGFALENFDAAGRYRRQEGFGYQGRVQKEDPLIDASGKLPDGTEINGIDDLKAAILSNDRLFVRCVTEKMFAYALGREMMLSDDAIVEMVVDQWQASKGSHQPRTLRSLIHQIVTSPLFAKR